VGVVAIDVPAETAEDATSEPALEERVGAAVDASERAIIAKGAPLSFPPHSEALQHSEAPPVARSGSDGRQATIEPGLQRRPKAARSAAEKRPQRPLVPPSWLRLRGSSAGIGGSSGGLMDRAEGVRCMGPHMPSTCGRWR